MSEQHSPEHGPSTDGGVAADRTATERAAQGAAADGGDADTALHHLFEPDPSEPRTWGLLKAAFAAEAMASRRYLYFAQQADVEGQPDVAAVFRAVGEGETGHAVGLLDFLAERGDPATGEPIESAEEALVSAERSERAEATRFAAYAAVARDEGFGEIAEWFETLARAEAANADRFAETRAAIAGAG